MRAAGGGASGSTYGVFLNAGVPFTDAWRYLRAPTELGETKDRFASSRRETKDRFASTKTQAEAPSSAR